MMKTQGPDFRKILRESYNNLRMSVRFTTHLRQIYKNANCQKILLRSYESLNTVNMTKYITVNTKTSFIHVISRNYQQVCNAV